MGETKSSPMNYDFGSHWETQCVPHLHSPELDCILKQAYEAVGPENHHYLNFVPNLKQPPIANLHKSSMWWEMLDTMAEPYKQDSKFKALISTLSVDEQKCALEAWSKLQESDHKCDVEFESSSYLTTDIEAEFTKCNSEVEDIILRQLGYDWKYNRDKLAFYVPFGYCHWWNPVFGLWLAKKVFPTWEWEVLEGKLHSTVYCRKKHMVFDIIAWGYNGRLHEYVAGSLLKPTSQSKSITTDSTLGGAIAYENSIIPIATLFTCNTV